METGQFCRVTAVRDLEQGRTSLAVTGAVCNNAVCSKIARSSHVCEGLASVPLTQSVKSVAYTILMHDDRSIN